MMESEATASQELPPGWAVARFDEIYDIIGGGTPSTKNKAYWEGDIPWVSSSDILGPREIVPRRFITKEAVDNSATNLVPEGSIIVVTRVGLGKVAIAPVPICFSQDSQALIPKIELIDTDYALYYLSIATQEFKQVSRGTTIEGVTKKQLASMTMPIPPLAEQRRIVAKIGLIFEYANQAEKNIILTKQKNAFFLPTILAAATTGELTCGWRRGRHLNNASNLIDRIGRERNEAWHQGSGKVSAQHYPAPQNLESDDLPLLPIEWAWASLDQLVKEGRPIVYGVIKPGPSIEGGVPIVKVNNIVDGAPINVSSLDRCSPERAGKFPRSTLSEGDLVISKDGSIGRVGLVPKELTGGNVTQHVMKVTPHSLIHGPYLMRALQSPFIQKWLRGRTKGVALQGVNVEDFRKIPIPIPPHEEQLEIARRLDALIDFSQDINSQVGRSLRRLKSTRQSVLIRAFEGKLVPQDPNDEPVSVLLDRVRAERIKGRKRSGTKGRQKQLLVAPMEA